MTHTVTVTVEPTEESDDFEWALGGTCDQHCRAWWECLNRSHRHPSQEYGYDRGEWSTNRTPELHTFIDGTWMVAAGCGYDHADTGEVFFDLADRGAHIGDTFDLDIEWDGDAWRVALVPETADPGSGS